jgi:hypothetical protein
MGLGFNPKQVSHTVEEGTIKHVRAKPRSRFHGCGILSEPPTEQVVTKTPRSYAEVSQTAAGIEDSFINDLIDADAFDDFDESFDVEYFYS